MSATLGSSAAPEVKIGPRAERPSHQTGAPRGRPQPIVDFFRRRTLGAIGGVGLVFLVLLAAAADILPLANPEETSFLEILKPPSAEHVLGTDSFGRDQLSRLIFGARTALLVGLVTSVVGATLGALVGTAAAYFAGTVDLLIERLMDVILSFPLIVLAIAVVAALGAGTGNLIVAITIPMIPRAARVVRSSGLAIRQMPYIEAARCIGAGHTSIVLRHMLPNVMAPYLIMLTAFLGQAILLEASLSFLGLGVAEPTPAWGLMLRSATQTAERAPWLAIAPGLAISAAVFAANLFGDSLRDALDPRLRTQ
jgi:peptide/nickel transport system permease protein